MFLIINFYYTQFLHLEIIFCKITPTPIMYEIIRLQLQYFNSTSDELIYAESILLNNSLYKH